MLDCGDVPSSPLKAKQTAISPLVAACFVFCGKWDPIPHPFQTILWPTELGKAPIKMEGLLVLDSMNFKGMRCGAADASSRRG